MSLKLNLGHNKGGTAQSILRHVGFEGGAIFKKSKALFLKNFFEGRPAEAKCQNFWRNTVPFLMQESCQVLLDARIVPSFTIK